MKKLLKLRKYYLLIKYLKFPISRLYSLTCIYTVSMLWFNVIDCNIETSNELFEIGEGKIKFHSALNIFLMTYLSFIPILNLPF